jgi:hypothetical protein
MFATNMAYTTAETDWPVFGPNAAIKDLIARFFSLLDSESQHVGNALADEIFTPNARAEFGGHLFTGQEGKYLTGSFP